jgi:hypothetical protein
VQNKFTHKGNQMSNLSLFKSGSVIPDYLREGSDATTKDIAGSSGGKTISIKGGVWRMIVGGEEVAKNEERAMNLVIIASGKGVTRTFYSEKYEEGRDIKPSCWSAEGIVPNEEVTNPQSKSCATCPQNIEGSGDGKARACRFSKRLAVALENDISGNIYRLSVPAKSYFGKADGDKMPLQAFGKFLSGHGIPITGIVTEARFDTAEAVPVLKFRAVRPLTQEEWSQGKAQSQTDEAKQAIEFKMVPSKNESQIALPAAFTEADIEETKEPTKRPSKKAESAPAPTKDVASVLADWGKDE